MSITQIITSIPIPGHRGVDTQTIFVDKQEAFQDALVGTTVTELNTFATQANAVQADVNTKANNAATSATSASTSASAASGSATSASTSATSASTSATAASGSATTASSAATSATASATSASNSATSATASATSATASATSASNSATSATASATSATASATSATASATSATASATSATASATSAAALFDSFDDRYLGTKSSAPTLDNDGNALISGTLYFNDVLNAMYVYDLGTTTWISLKFNPTDHTTLTNIGTLTHAQLESLKANVATTVQKDSSTGAAYIPSGTTAQRPVAPASGYMRFNTTLSSAEVWNGTMWTPVGGGATGGGADTVFVETSYTITTDYTLTTGKSATTVGNASGDVTINDGITVTIPDSSSWVILGA